MISLRRTDRASWSIDLEQQRRSTWLLKRHSPFTSSRGPSSSSVSLSVSSPVFQVAVEPASAYRQIRVRISYAAVSMDCDGFTTDLNLVASDRKHQDAKEPSRQESGQTCQSFRPIYLRVGAPLADIEFSAHNAVCHQP